MKDQKNSEKTKCESSQLDTLVMCKAGGIVNDVGIKIICNIPSIAVKLQAKELTNNEK